MVERTIRLKPGETARIIDSQVKRAKELAKKKGKRHSPVPKPTEPVALSELRDFAMKFSQESAFVRSRKPADLEEWFLATGNKPTEIALALRSSGITDRTVRVALENLFSQVVPEEIAGQIAAALFAKLKESLPDTEK